MRQIFTVSLMLDQINHIDIWDLVWRDQQTQKCCRAQDEKNIGTLSVLGPSREIMSHQSRPTTGLQTGLKSEQTQEQNIRG